MNIRTQRIYEAAQDDDGCRVLVDRLWPRGVSKEVAALDHWLREVAPSAELRHWFGHDPARWEEFRQRYRDELKDDAEAARALTELRALAAANKTLTLLYAAHDTEHNNAVVLQELLQTAG